MANKSTKRQVSIKGKPVMHRLSLEEADHYAEQLGLFDMGFTYDAESWGSMGYTVWVASRGCHTNVYLARRDCMNPVYQGIVIEVECGGTWSPHDKRKNGPLPEAKLMLLLFLERMGLTQATPLLRAHKIDCLLS